jgi:hypothetical protein
MPNYSNSKVYVLKSNQTDNVYIGSTVKQYLSSRLSAHKYDYKKFLKNESSYMSSFEILQYNDCYIEILELVNCSCKEELQKKEKFFINNYTNCINNYMNNNRLIQKTATNIFKEPQRIEYKKKNYEENKERYVNYKKDWYSKNRERILQKRKECYIKVCDR